MKSEHSTPFEREENTKEFYAAAGLANKLVPFIVRNGLMTPVGADARLSYYEDLPGLLHIGERVLPHWRHEVLVELRTFGGMVAKTPIGDLEPHPLALESLMMFGEACTLRVVVDNECRSILLWTKEMGWAMHGAGPWEKALLEAIGRGRTDLH